MNTMVINGEEGVYFRKKDANMAWESYVQQRRAAERVEKTEVMSDISEDMTGDTGQGQRDSLVSSSVVTERPPLPPDIQRRLEDVKRYWERRLRCCGIRSVPTAVSCAVCP